MNQGDDEELNSTDFISWTLNWVIMNLKGITTEVSSVASHPHVHRVAVHFQKNGYQLIPSAAHEIYR